MPDLAAVAELLVDRVRTFYPQDVAIIACYGSYVQGRATATSDLDIFFIPRTPRGLEAALQFLLEGVGFDFWPVSWERAERMAGFDDALSTLIMDSRVLYACTPEDRQRFEALRSRAASMEDPAQRAAMLQKASRRLLNCRGDCAAFSLPAVRANLTATRLVAGKVMTGVLESLALLNQTHYTRGPGQSMDEVHQLTLKPDGFEEALHGIVTASDTEVIAGLCSQLVSATRALIITNEAAAAPAQVWHDALGGFVEELTGMINKLVHACDTTDLNTAFFAALSLQYETAVALAAAQGGTSTGTLTTWDDYAGAYVHAGLPDLVGLVGSATLSDLRQATLAFQKQLMGVLNEHQVPVRVFATLEDLRSFVSQE
ncbi:MAG: nucleotidyltransferase domain-containing protein [Candidatus Cryosericum sp.]